MRLIFSTFLCLSFFAVFSQNNGKICYPSSYDPDNIYPSTTGAILEYPELGIYFFEGHETDSLYGFLETSDFESVIFIENPRPHVIINGLGEDYSVLEPAVYKIDSQYKSPTAVYWQGSRKLTIYKGKD